MQALEILKTIQARYRDEQLNPPLKMNMPGKGFFLKRDHKLVILGGMPGTGKSAYMSSEAALALAEQNVLVFVMTYEMQQEKIVERLLCNGGNLLCDDLDDYKLLNSEIAEAVEEVEKRLERIFITSPKTVEEAYAYMDTILANPDIADTQEKPRIIIVWDYLQRIPFSNVDESRVRISTNLQAIRDINERYDAQSVILSSLNRSNYNATNMEAFKEAGDIESDCDMAIIMRIAEYDSEHENWVPVDKDRLNEARKPLTVPILFSMVKNRHGAEIEFIMQFDKSRQKMSEMKDDDCINFVQPKKDNKKKDMHTKKHFPGTDKPTLSVIPGFRIQSGKGQ